jgi:hypothetical protein
MGAQPPLAAIRPFGHGGQAHQQLRIAFLEPLLDDKPVGKPWAHRTECGDCEGLRDCSFGRDEASFIHAFHRNDMALRPNDRGRNRHAHGVGLFDDRLDELSAFYCAQFRHRRPPSGVALKV